MNILLKAATIVDATQKNLHLKKRDILISNGKIVKIAANISSSRNTRVIDKNNLHVSVGWFDSGVAFGEPGFEERETIENGLRVAGLNGYTDLALLPNTNPLPDTSGDIVFLQKMAAGSATSLHPMGTLSKNSTGKEMAELYDMHKAGAVAFYDHQRSIESSYLLKIALQYSQGFNGLICSFPLDNSLASNGVMHEGHISTKMGLNGIPEVAEHVQVARDLAILEYTGGRFHLPTISSVFTINLIQDARKKGLDVSCSVAIHSLFYTDEKLVDFDSRNKVLPPLRDDKTRKALLKALIKGEIDMLTSNHVPIDIEEKRVELDNAAFGSLGLESCFGLLNQLVDTDQAVEILTRGYERFGLEKPQIAVGADARITLFDPDKSYTLKESDLESKSKNSMSLGQELKGKAYGVITPNGICI